MNVVCSIICLVCCVFVIFTVRRFEDILNQLDEKQLRKMWEADLYEDKKDDTN